MYLEWSTHREGGRVGHLRYWERKTNLFGIKVTEADNDLQAKLRTWERNFEVMDFETTRNDAKDAYGSYTCYSDGSRLANHSGYGYVINKFNRPIYEGFDYMGPKATVFLAEVRAISTIATVLMQCKKQKIVIRCDSQAAIKAISSINICSKTVAECRRLLNKLGSKNTVSISWIKAHSAHAGNESADRLAKMGANQTIGPPRFKYYEASASFSQSLIERSNRKWQRRWDKDPTMYKHSKCFIKLIKNNITKLNHLLKYRDRDTVGKVIQFITGHCNFMYYTSKIHNFLDPSCRRCQEEDETPIHLIKDCKTLIYTRRMVFDGQEVLNDNFDWNATQVLRFMKMGHNIWDEMNQHQF
jgi:ribonuclease HI